jgi:hypothetical protein
MDFGSARPAVVEINNRMDALALQEEAEVRHFAKLFSTRTELYAWSNK